MKLLIGGSPCTHWSIAQTKNRETEASGIGWELFLNYRIARDKYQPDFFLYENNKSMAPAIKAQISKELGVEPVLINSALVSAQNRQRLYWVGKREPDGTYSQVAVEQPADRGILLRDILESGAVTWHEKAYTLRASAATKQGVSNVLRHIETNGHFGYMGVAEPVNMTVDGKAQCLRATYYKDGIRNMVGNTIDRKTCVAEPVRIGTIENDAKNQTFDSQQYRVYSPDGKSITLCGNGGGLGAKTGLYATPVATDADGILHLGSLYGQHSRWGVFAKDGKCPTITASMGMGGGHVPMVPTQTDEEGHCQKNPTTAKQIYEVRDGKISIGNTWYPIKLRDGFYIIRKLTVRECMRLQTVPEEYVFPVSDTQAYKMLGNGWTVDVIAHIMSHFEGLTEDPVEVLSMYDGMSCGHIALDKLGVNVTAYYATEIDKYAIQTTQHNYPETVQLGDAFQVRGDDWRLESL
jgi:DNA (cytosine-5)-methyltransferase 3A